MAEFHAPLWELMGDHRHGVYAITDPEGAGILAPAGPDDRWLFGCDLARDLVDDTASARELLRHRIERASGVPGIPIRIDRFGWFTSAAQIADTFSSGRVFLAGDAAHRVTPRGGTGLNTAIASGRDLGWKLAWVLLGWAPPEFLSTYEDERRPAAAHNVTRSADPEGTRRDAISRASGRPRRPHRARVGRRPISRWRRTPIDHRPGRTRPHPPRRTRRRGVARQSDPGGSPPITTTRLPRAAARASDSAPPAPSSSAPTACPSPAGGPSTTRGRTSTTRSTPSYRETRPPQGVQHEHTHRPPMAPVRHRSVPPVLRRHSAHRARQRPARPADRPCHPGHSPTRRRRVLRAVGLFRQHSPRIYPPVQPGRRGWPAWPS